MHIAINKKLMVDISNQSKTPHTIISVDTSNYFDWVAYLISAMTCLYFSLPLDYIYAFFQDNLKYTDVSTYFIWYILLFLY